MNSFEMESIRGIMIYLVAMNAIAFVAFGIDKLRARKHRWRISEATLLGLAAAGGSIGAYLGMKTWRHKTLHKKFTYGIPAIIAIQLCIAAWLVIKGINVN